MQTCRQSCACVVFATLTDDVTRRDVAHRRCKATGLVLSIMLRRCQLDLAGAARGVSRYLVSTRLTKSHARKEGAATILSMRARWRLAAILCSRWTSAVSSWQIITGLVSKLLEHGSSTMPSVMPRFVSPYGGLPAVRAR